MPSQLPSHRVVGSPAHWARETARLGVTLALALGALQLEALPPLRAIVAFAAIPALAAGGVGAALGALAPTVLERARGRVPLPVLVAVQPVVGGAGGALAVAVATALLGALFPVTLSEGVAVGLVGAWIGAVAALLWWLPFTVATVTGQRWPVTAVVGVTVPLLSFALFAR